MPPHSVKSALFRFAAPPAVALGLLAGPAAASAAPRPAAQEAEAPSSPAQGDAEKAAGLANARERAARAFAIVDDLKRELGPGHLTDPMPDIDRTFGLASLRADYADAQRRAAGYRATLGDQHPTLKATEQLMDDLRAQLLEGTRRALASAERDAADARSDVASAERRLAAPARLPATEARTADATASIAAQPRPAARAASPLSLPPAAAAPAGATAAAEAPPERPAERAHSSFRTLAGALAAAALAALLSAGAALRLLRPRRSRAAPVPARRVEPALAHPAAPTPEEPRPAGAESVPVLQRLTVPLAGEALARLFGPRPGQVAADAAALHGTLRTAFDDAEARMTVLVAAAAGLPAPEADGAAFALALAAAAAGRRPLLMETRAAGRLRGALVPAAAAPMLIEAGGATRTLYRLGPEGATVALLPCDPGEAEAAAAAGARPATGRLRGFDAFDTVILLGDDAARLASSADLLVLAAPAGTAPAALAEAARCLSGAGRPCGAVLVAAEAEPAPAPAGRPVPLPRRRLGPEGAPAVRLGLRGSIEPNRRRLVG